MSIPCVRFKDGVRMDPMTPTLARLVCALDEAARMKGIDLTVTCGRDSHNLGDPHTRGTAVDVRTANFPTTALLLATFRYLTSILGDLFTVLYEVPVRPTDEALRLICYVNPGATAAHFHIQSRRFTIYPPQDGFSETTKA